MSLEIPAEEMKIYQRTALKRWRQEQAECARRQERAWELARQAATLLKAEYQVERVMVFGSLAGDRFHLHSDVDLAAWGLTSANWLKAMAAVRDLSSEINLELVDVACCSSSLLAAIEREGIEL